MHYFRRPHTCCQDMDILRRIPRKTDGMLLHQGNGPVAGWGMHLSDGIDYLRFGFAGFLGLIACLMSGVVWTRLQHNDVQGGMAIAQSLMVVVTYLVTIVGMAEED